MTTNIRTLRRGVPQYPSIQALSDLPAGAGAPLRFRHGPVAPFPDVFADRHNKSRSFLCPGKLCRTAEPMNDRL